MVNIEISEDVNYGYTIWNKDKGKFILQTRYGKFFSDDEIEDIIGEKQYKELQKGKFQFKITQKTLNNI